MAAALRTGAIDDAQAGMLAEAADEYNMIAETRALMGGVVAGDVGSVGDVAGAVLAVASSVRTSSVCPLIGTMVPTTMTMER